ncbi:shikimate dehydrogenase [Vandammella animalimorsus]|uniref:Shikimate dehydrogenase (NADP(+)) n=1 Tax=Vandammella animalimorsus TaxID=2029117 RepID=A0A2A2AS58_9BURK|nr:shikimate dehydrogenase [Vandammella animalimorsus]PAT41410.1 shikimate dehydrogenase [Vandammella animalimorsus]
MPGDIATQAELAELIAQGQDAYVVIGNPIAHSRSPAIHQHFAQLTGQRLVYARCLSPLEGFAQTLDSLRQHGIKGCNITVPFKHQAAQLASQCDARVQLAQAANTLVLNGPQGPVQAFNTDGLGLVRDLCDNAGLRLTGAHILLLGAGGAAAGALAPLLQAGPASLHIANRSAERAQALAQRHAALAAEHGVQLQALALDEIDHTPLPAMQLLINATASSLQGAALPIQNLARLLAPGALAYDMMYGAAAQPFLQWVSSQGQNVRTRDGLGMLVEQAAESFALWRGLRPPSAPVLAALRQQISAP